MTRGCKSSNGLARADFNASLQRRFAEKCAPKDSRGCIEWMGTKTSKGYGLLRAAGQYAIRTTAHRISWVLAHGDLAPAACVLHRCDNPSCVNSEHLFLGSPKENTEDMVSKGRHSWRNGTPWQKLSSQDAESVRAMRHEGHTQQEVADVFGVSRPLISMIENGHIHCSARG